MMEVRGDCPDCVNKVGTEDLNAHLYYNTETQVWFCFRCGFTGHGLNPCENVEYVHKPTYKVKIVLPVEAHRLEECTPPGGLLGRYLSEYFDKHHLNYRHIVSNYHLYLHHENLLTAVFRREKLLFYQERHILTKKFFNLQIEHKPLFWNVTNGDCPVVIVESATNAIRLDRFTRAVALFGKFLADDHAKTLADQDRELVICLDKGEFVNSIRMARKLWLFGARQVRIVDMRKTNQGKDVCDLEDKECKRMLKL